MAIGCEREKGRPSFVFCSKSTNFDFFAPSAKTATAQKDLTDEATSTSSSKRISITSSATWHRLNQPGAILCPWFWLVNLFILQLFSIPFVAAVPRDRVQPSRAPGPGIRVDPYTMNNFVVKSLTAALKRPLSQQQWIASVSIPRTFSSTAPSQNAELPSTGAPLNSESLISKLSQSTRAAQPQFASETKAKMLETLSNPYGALPAHHLHVYAHKHNTHLTLTKPNRDPMLSISCGSIGFRKSHRSGFDAAHQLSSYMLAKIQERGFLMDIKQVEVILRGFGPGREAFTKVLLGNEGKKLREKVTRVTDATRLKFGGTRSPKVRRLG